MKFNITVLNVFVQEDEESTVVTRYAEEELEKFDVT